MKFEQLESTHESRVKNSKENKENSGYVRAKFHYAILVADRSEAGCRPAASWNLAYHLAR